MALMLLFVVLTVIGFTTMMLLLRPSRRLSQVGARLHAVLAETKSSITMDGAIAQTSARAPRASLWIEAALHDTVLLRSIHLLLLQSQSRWSAGSVVLGTVMCGLVGPIICYAITGDGVIAAIACAACCAPYGVLRWQRSRRLRAFEDALPGAIEMCSRSLRAGHSIAAAFGTLAQEAAEPARTEFSEVFRKANYGLPLRDCLMEMLERVPSVDLRILVTGILVQKDTGGNLPEIMDRIVGVIRDRVRVQAEVRTHTAQGRLTGWILCMLPPALLLLINFINPGYSRLLLHDAFGRKLLYSGLCLLFTGAFLIHRIIRGVEV